MKYVALIGLALLGACDESLESPESLESAEEGPLLRIYCATDCVNIEVVSGYSAVKSGGRVIVSQGSTTVFSYDIDGSSGEFGSWADEWVLVDCHDEIVSTYGLGAGLTATTEGTGTLVVSSSAGAIIQVETNESELHEGLNPSE